MAKEAETQEQLDAGKTAAALTTSQIDPLSVSALIDSNTSITFKVTEKFAKYFDLVQPDLSSAGYYNPKRKKKVAAPGATTRQDARTPDIDSTVSRRILLKGRLVKFIREDKATSGKPRYMSARLPSVMNINAINYWVATAFPQAKRPKHFVMPSGSIYVVDATMTADKLGSNPNFSKGTT